MISKSLDEAKADVKKGIKEAQAHAEAMFGGKGLADPIPTVEVTESFPHIGPGKNVIREGLPSSYVSHVPSFSLL